MSDKKGKRNNKKSGLGIALWVLAFLIIILIFMVKQEEIKTNLQKVNFFDRLFGSTPTFITEHKVDEKKQEIEENTVIDLKKNEVKKNVQAEKPSTSEVEKKTVQNTQQTQPQTKPVEEKKQEPVKTVETKKEEPKKVETKTPESVKPVEKEPAKAPEKNQPVEQKKTEAKTETVVPEPVKPATIQAKICFIAIDRDGPIVRKEVTRNVEKDSPLTNAILSLLKGPSSAEADKGCKSLIPSGTRLYSVSVKNGVATMNFSEEFEFNQFGVEGYLAQLMQIVYTATNFSTVKSVQILIEGQKKEYLGSEGVWIGSPLTRASFR